MRIYREFESHSLRLKEALSLNTEGLLVFTEAFLDLA